MTVVSKSSKRSCQLSVLSRQLEAKTKPVDVSAVKQDRNRRIEGRMPSLRGLGKSCQLSAVSIKRVDASRERGEITCLVMFLLVPEATRN